MHVIFLPRFLLETKRLASIEDLEGFSGTMRLTEDLFSENFPSFEKCSFPIFGFLRGFWLSPVGLTRVFSIVEQKTSIFFRHSATLFGRKQMEVFQHRRFFYVFNSERAIFESQG